MIRDYGAYFAQRWAEAGVPAQLAALAARGETSEEAYKAIMCPVLVRTAGELASTARYEGRRHPDVGLLFKNAGNHFDAGNGLLIAADILCIADTDAAGKVTNPRTFAIVDCIIAGGSKDSRPAWQVQGLASGGDIDRWREAPAVPDDPGGGPPPVDPGQGGGGGVVPDDETKASVKAIEQSCARIELQLQGLGLKLDQQRTEVIGAVRQFGADLLKAIAAGGGLGGLLGGLLKAPKAASALQASPPEASHHGAQEAGHLRRLPEGFDNDPSWREALRQGGQ